MVDRWRLSLAQNGVSMAHARFEEAKQKIVRDQKIADEKEAAEIAAAIDFYERTGQSPEGYDIEEIAACRSSPEAVHGSALGHRGFTG
jgi:hypothetical protein